MFIPMFLFGCSAARIISSAAQHSTAAMVWQKKVKNDRIKARDEVIEHRAMVKKFKQDRVCSLCSACCWAVINVAIPLISVMFCMSMV
jgi:hypothetical protein